MLKGLILLVITSMIFFPDKVFYEKPGQYGFDYEDIIFKTEDGVPLFGWYLTAPAGVRTGNVLIHFHGNAGNISGRLSKVKGWVDRGFDVFLADYRGYGKSEGEIKHQDDILRDARAALQWVRDKKGIPPEKIVVFGESLGTYPAIRLAAEAEIAAVILEAPYTSFVELGEIHYGMLPSFMRNALLKDFSFPNEEWIGKVRTPLFVLHGSQDETCPYEMGVTLFEKAPEPKGFLSIPDGTHNDLPFKAGEDYWNKPHEFLQKYLPKSNES